MNRRRVLVIFSVLIASVFLSRAFADVIQSITETQTPEVISTPIVGATETPTVTDSASPIASPDVSDAPLVMPSSTAIARTPLAVVDSPTVDTSTSLTLIAPASIGIDPRSNRYLLPHLKLKATTSVLLCFVGHGNTMDIATIEKGEALSDKSLLFSGEESSRMLVSGSPAALTRFLTLTPIWVVAKTGTLSGSYFTVSATALTAPSIDKSFCSHAQSSTSTPFRPLEIEFGMARGTGKLK